MAFLRFCCLLACVASGGFATPKAFDAITIASIDGETPRPLSPTAPPMYVDQRVIVRGGIGVRVARGAQVYPLVRRAGEPWCVQSAAHLVDGATWEAELQIGAPAEKGGVFEVQMVLARGSLPLGPIPSEVLGRSVTASSGILRVVRKVAKPVVWIPSIDGRIVRVVDGEVLNVGHQAQIDVRALDLPARSDRGPARIGVVIHPIEPFSDARWIMVDTLGAPAGSITGHFGIKRLHNFHKFRVSAFVTWTLPPLGVPIPSSDWSRWSETFIAQSRPVDVWLWYGETRITYVDNVAALPTATILADQQAEVRGTLRRPLQSSTTSAQPRERVWLVCTPREQDPWVAGWTPVLEGGGRWTISPAQLWTERRPRLFDLVALVSSDDLTKVDAATLRLLIHETQERSRERVRVRIKAMKGGSR